MPDDLTPEQLEAKATEEAAKAAEKPPEYVSKADYDALFAHTTKLTEGMEKVGERLAVIDKVAAMLAGKPEPLLTPQEQDVVSELRRLMPHILPNAAFLDHAPKLLEVVEGASKATTDTLVNAAFSYQLELQKDAGISIEDPKANFYVGAAIREFVNQDPGRKARFWRGDRSVIKEGFEEVKKTVLDPLRTTDRRKTAGIVAARPVNAAPAGSAGVSGTGAPSIDFTDRKSVRDAFKAALA